MQLAVPAAPLHLPGAVTVYTIVRNHISGCVCVREYQHTLAYRVRVYLR